MSVCVDSKILENQKKYIVHELKKSQISCVLDVFGWNNQG